MHPHKLLGDKVTPSLRGEFLKMFTGGYEASSIMECYMKGSTSLRSALNTMAFAWVSSPEASAIQRHWRYNFRAFLLAVLDDPSTEE